MHQRLTHCQEPYYTHRQTKVDADTGMHVDHSTYLPEYGCTLTPHSAGLRLKAARARVLQRFSILSMFSLPP